MGHFHKCAGGVSKLCEHLIPCVSMYCEVEAVCGACARDLKQMSLDAAFWNEIEAGIQRAWEREHYAS